MKNGLKWLAAIAVFALPATALPALAASAPIGVQDQNRDHPDGHDQQQHPDYSHNKYYSLGNREGYQDYKHKTQRTEHNHNFKSDDQRQAHDYGYQQGLQGHRGYHQDPH